MDSAWPWPDREGDQATITETTIAAVPGRRDLYGLVSDALGSPRLEQPVELGALWAALPDLVDAPLPDERWPRPIRVVPGIYTLGDLQPASRTRDGYEHRFDTFFAGLIGPGETRNAQQP